VELILGSQSPRRREILEFFSLPFIQATPPFDEEAIPFEGNPQDYVQTLARGKAESLVSRFPAATILTADTIVYREGTVYGKPRDRQEAYQYLQELSGRWHSVFTGLSLYTTEQSYQSVEETRVLFHSLNEQQMHAYHAVLEFTDKAGGYMIQGAGSLIVKRIEGCYYNVAGLPLNALATLLLRANIDLWHHLKRDNGRWISSNQV